MSTPTELQTVTINGEERRVPYGIRVPDLLRAVDLDPDQARGIAVAVNDEVVPRREWVDHVLGEGDRVEIVTAKQGG